MSADEAKGLKMKQIVLEQHRRISSLPAKTGPKGWSYVKLSDLAAAVNLTTKQVIQRYLDSLAPNGAVGTLVNRRDEPSRFLWAHKQLFLDCIATNRPYLGTTIEVAKGWADDVLLSVKEEEERKLIADTANQIFTALDSEPFVSLSWREDSEHDHELAVRINHLVYSYTQQRSDCILVAYSLGTDDDPAITWHWIFYLEPLIDVTFVPYGPRFNERVKRMGYTRLAASLDPHHSGMYLYKNR